MDPSEGFGIDLNPPASATRLWLGLTDHHGPDFNPLGAFHPEKAMPDIA